MDVARRRFLALAACVFGLYGGVGHPGRALANTPQTLASTFISDLVAAARRNDVDAVEAVLDRYVDMAYIANAAIGDRAEGISPDTLRRMILALKRHLAQQAASFMAYGHLGNVQWGQERQRGRTGVEISARFISNSRELDLPQGGLAIGFLVGPDARRGDLAIRDMALGREWVSDTLRQTLDQIAEVSDDPELWIAAFGGEPMPVPDIALEDIEIEPEQAGSHSH
ncbi:ABC transporter substrate-binding protein [Hyphomicrobium sp.]|uniref:ABC transporter substrate-binding protein n=1 Tax=Hyphomicrobium sp. TaxID=82 RepID=UPI002FE1055F